MLPTNFSESDAILRNALHTDDSFDAICRTVVIANRQASFFLMDGFVKDELFEKILEFFYGLKADDPALNSVDSFMRGAVPYCETTAEGDCDAIVTAVLSGQTALIVDGFDKAILLDIRTYPQRDTSEPEKDKSFRGSRDGFVETMILNCALIRRRIRSAQLRMEYHEIGRASKTDITLCYIEDRVDQRVLKALREKLSCITVDALTMNQESLAEMLLPHRWFDPFPKFKYTERPDAASAQILEGDVVILIDNSPAAMTLPTSIFDVMEEANDYYFPPLTGTYLRLTRYFVLLLMLLLTPTWLLLVEHPSWIPQSLFFLVPQEAPNVPIIWQLLILELGIDGLKLATLNTPSMLTTSLSIIAGVVVGDFAVQSGWFSAETMLYMALVAVGGYNQPSWELGYAMKFMRLMLLILTAAFALPGYIGGLIVIFLILITRKTFAGHSYLYPLIPFNGRILLRKLFRPSIRSENNR